MNNVQPEKFEEIKNKESLVLPEGLESSSHLLDDGVGYIETLRSSCPSGITVSRTRINFNSHEDKTYYQNIAKIECKELSLFLQVIKKGSAKIQEKTSDKPTTISLDNAYFCITNKTEILYEFTKNEDVELISITFPLSLCERLIGSIYLSTFISNLKFICEIEKNLPISQGINIPLSENTPSSIESEHNQNTALRIQQSAIDFLITLTEIYTDKRKKQQILDPKGIAWIIHSELEKMGRKIISYAEIQERFQVSAKAINSEFTQIFGLSIAKFAQKTRFQDAARLLSETSMPVKSISNMLGYSNVNNFIIAFKKEFQHSPIRYRKIHRMRFLDRQNINP